MAQSAPVAPARVSPPWVVLAMLLLVYCFNFLDRQILAILARQVQAELHLSDGQLGALGGLAFAMLFATMAVPLGLLADRTGRARVIAASLAVWSLFTVLCGLATGFAQLFVCRLGVGIGEAGGVAPSYALIAERFAPEHRARALAVYALGIPLGGGLGALLGSQIAAAVNWRTAFVVLGLAGLVVALPFRLLVRDMPRPAPAATAPPIGTVFARLARLPVFWMVAGGAALGSICGYGFLFWVPTLLQRAFGLSLVQTGAVVGAQSLLGGVAGVLAGGVLADRLGHTSRAAYARVPAVAYLVCCPCFIAVFMTHDPLAAFLLLLPPAALSYVWLGPVTTAIQHMVPAADRATASATYLLINNGIGLGLGPWLIGRLSDHFAAHGPDGLRWAMSLASLAYLGGAALMLLAAPHLTRAWRD